MDSGTSWAEASSQRIGRAPGETPMMDEPRSELQGRARPVSGTVRRNLPNKIWLATLSIELD
jgi:hypothetical protein